MPQRKGAKLVKLKRLKQMFENWKVSAIFAVLNTKAVPWAHAVNSALLDLDYVGNFSGRKIVSNLVESLLGEDEDATLTPADLSMLCDIIVALYGTKWSKLWETMSFDYNPIENYSMVETMTNDATVTQYGKTRTRTDNLQHQRTDNLQHQRTDNLQHQRTDNLQHAKTGTETETPNTHTSEDKSVYGFNSVEAVPTDEREIANTGTNQMTYNTQDADTGTQTEADTGTQTDAHTGTQTDANTGTQTESDTGSDTSTRNYRLTRAGNIGVTTSQQMVESERELWRMWDFFRGVVYPDIDRVLTIEIY